MDPRILNLLECLASVSTQPEQIERCGFLLAMVLEKNSSLKSPDSMYKEILPEPYLNISLDGAEYRNLVEKVSSLLNQSTINAEVQAALLFTLGGTDGRTLDLTIPVLVRLLDENLGRSNFDQGVNALRTMLSSPEHVLEHAAAILSGVEGFSGLDRIIERTSASSKEAATVALKKLKRQLQQPGSTPN
jgi:hypothetical protein